MSSPLSRWSLAGCCLLALLAAPARAIEPNETFDTRTMLADGTFLVEDELTPGFLEVPDTLLGIKGPFGDIVFVDDDGSELGSGTASGASGIPTNSGSIDFSVTGFGDSAFFGDHFQSGEYLVVVDVYDFFGDFLESFVTTGTLAPGVVNDFSFNDFEWIGGSYDVNLNNVTGNVIGGDVDFFTFSNLTPGEEFTVETFQPLGSDIDTILGWYDDAGVLIELNDDLPDGTNITSLIQGLVPASGKLTFAVTGYPDEEFLGRHTEDDFYELRLTLPGGSPADFDGDGDVDGADLAQWRGDFGLNGDSDADNDGDSDGADFLIWQRALTPPQAAAAQAAVPEPGTAILLAACVFGAITRRTAGIVRSAV